MATLTPNQHCTWTLTGGTRRVKPVAGDVKAVLDAAAGTIRLETSKTGVQLLGGKAAFATPMDGAGLPAPIQGVRLPGNQWIGKGWWQTDVKCTGYSALVTDDGPVFARARLRYDFEGGKYYAATVELNAGQDMAVVSEEFNLSEGTGYPMSGLSGMKPEVKYAYVYPKFSSPDRALIWDWWGQTQAKLPTPNEYCFSFGKELQPDRAEFLGYNKYNNIANAGNRTSSGGEGELKYDRDGRFAYINVYGQWGDEETPYLGLYNTQKPTAMLGVVGLRPSQWLHPDIAPHPDTTLQQYTQTNCLTFERRTTGDAFFRAPACLGKRVYGIGGMERTLGAHIGYERSGPHVSDPTKLGDDLALRHVRLGRLELNTVKDWVLYYDEKVADKAADPNASTAEKKVVSNAIARASFLVRHFAQVEKGLMDYGLDEDPIATEARKALDSPACTPEQARELRKWLSAIMYYALDPDFAPPRAAGFAWGSANMMAQVQCRACYVAALVPNHPQGKSWRAQLAKFVTLYLKSQVNDAGDAGVPALRHHGH